MAEQRIKDLCGQMTEEEKISLITGADFFESRGVPRLGVPRVRMSDGPHGVRAQEVGKADHLGLNASAAATCFPSGAAMASGWDPALIETVGRAVGEEARYYGIQVMLGPALNIKRSPLCGRNFEYFSEDPYLAGKLAAAHIRGVQSTGVAACPKHFACNNQEDRRMVSNSILDERTLREIYLTAFETAVKEGAPWSIMCAYNKINGTFCSENPYLLDQILRREWGFDGAVISDWGAVSHRGKAAKAGMDLEMPGTQGFSDEMVKGSLADETLTGEELDACAERVLRLTDRTAGAPPVDHVDFAAHHELAVRAAEACMVLLKNEDDVLPLKRGEKLAVLGALARRPRYQGGGSSHVSSWRVDDGLASLEAELAAGQILYGEGYDLAHGDTADPERLEQARKLAAQADKAVIFVGLTEEYETEGSDRRDMKLPYAHDLLIREVSRVNPNVVVVLMAGAPVELPWLERVKGLLLTYTAGDGLGRAAARILSGAVNPSGKLAETFPLALEHTPAYLNFREDKTDIRYAEGVFVGYRWYEKRRLPVLFPFGFGLSYTDFSYGELQMSRTKLWDGQTVTVSVEVTNTGGMAGQECVQLYVAARESSLPRPVKELKGFQKLALDPGQTGRAVFELDRRAFAFYDEKQGKWAVEPGQFDIYAGASSSDLRCAGAIEVEGQPWRPLRQVTWETTYGELADHPATFPILCDILSPSPMYRPRDMPDAPDFLRNLPLWTVNHMSGRAVTPRQFEAWIDRMNQALAESGL